jgi:hypothetical protein
MPLFQVLIYGQVPTPEAISSFGSVQSGAIGVLIQLILQILIIFAGLFALFNLLIAGYAFMSAGDDPKKVAGAWSKIYLSILGLAVVAGSFVLAAIFGWLLYKDFGALLRPAIPIL